MNPMLQASVLLPTYNRRQLLKEAIESLYGQTVSPDCFEVIVVDNCSSDGTEEMIEALRKEAPFEIVYRRMERNGGCFRSLNLSAQMARTEILASLDSDCWADPDWLRKGIQAFRENPELAFVAGHIADKPGQPVTFFSLRNGAPRGENLFYPSGNCFYRRNIFLAMGGYDESLAYGDVGTSPVGCSDSDLAWRMREAGYPYCYCPDAVAYHEVKTVAPLDWLKAHWRIVAVPALIRRHPGLRQLLAWRLFFLRFNLLFYLLLAALALSLAVHPAFLVLAVPFIVDAARSPEHRFSPARLPKMAGRVGMLCLRQAVICSSLIYGSYRARTLVL